MEGIISGGNLEGQAQAKLLLDISGNVFLLQQIPKPIRLYNILDLFFTNNKETVSTYQVEKTVFSDHSLITINTTYRKARLEQTKTIPPEPFPFARYNLFSDAINWEQVQSCFGEANWDQIIGGNNLNTMLQAFTNIVLETCEDHSPKNRSRTATYPTTQHPKERLNEKQSTSQQADGELSK